MDQQLAEFLQATERCTEQLREMLPLEQEKYQALISDDTNQMEEMIQVQQAAIMKLKSLEAVRLDCQEKAGLGQMTSDQILESIPAEDKEAFTACFTDLRKAAEELRICNAKAMEIARVSTVFWQSIDPPRKTGRSCQGHLWSQGDCPQQNGQWFFISNQNLNHKIEKLHRGEERNFVSSRIIREEFILRPTFMGFETAKSGINVSQKALDITGNNLANMDTAGYTRQRLDVNSIAPSSYSTRIAINRIGLTGQGVEGLGVGRTRDAFLDKRFRDEYAPPATIPDPMRF